MILLHSCIENSEDAGAGSVMHHSIQNAPKALCALCLGVSDSAVESQMGLESSLNVAAA